MLLLLFSEGRKRRKRPISERKRPVSASPVTARGHVHHIVYMQLTLSKPLNAPSPERMIVRLEAVCNASKSKRFGKMPKCQNYWFILIKQGSPDDWDTHAPA